MPPCYISMDCFGLSIQRNKFIIVKPTIWTCCMYSQMLVNKYVTYIVKELCNSSSSSIMTKKYIMYITRIHSTLYSLYHVVGQVLS